MSVVASSGGEVTSVASRESSGSQSATGRPRLRDLLRPPGESGLDLRNTWQIVAGAVLVPLGFVGIILGWAGAAHGRVDQQQIPYIISGGLLGLAAVIVGAFLFWAHWLYRIYDQADLHHQAAMEQQAEFQRTLIQVLGGNAAGLAGGSATDAAAATAEYVATPTGTNFHIPECPIVANHGSLRKVTAAQAKKMKPCRICEPGS